MRGRAAVCSALLLAACAARPSDPFCVAERALVRDDLLAALSAYDTVPINHPRYPEARAAAIGLERRMRRGHELVLEALILRGEWRDEAAIDRLLRARQQWASLPGLDQWIRATEQRLRLFASAPELPDADLAAPAELAAEPLLEIADIVAGEQIGPHAAPLVEAAPLRVAVAGALVEGGGSLDKGAIPVQGGEGGALLPMRGDDPVAPGLVAVEMRLGRGDLDGAVSSLLELHKRHADDPRIRGRLARLLQQRALLRYGEGAVAAAIVDWQQVMELEPNHATAAILFQEACKEIGWAPRSSRAQ